MVSITEEVRRVKWEGQAGHPGLQQLPAFPDLLTEMFFLTTHGARDDFC